MSTCGDPLLLIQILALYIEKCIECNCVDCTDIPTIDELCEAGGLTAIYDGIKAFEDRSGSDCDPMTFPPSDLDPGPPPRCITNEYLNALLSYLDMIECVPGETCNLNIYDAIQEAIVDTRLGIYSYYIWHENGLYFPPGTYTSQYVSGMMRYKNYLGANQIYSLQSSLNPNVQYKLAPIAQTYDGSYVQGPFWDNRAPGGNYQNFVEADAVTFWDRVESQFTVTGVPYRIGVLLRTIAWGTSPKPPFPYADHNDVLGHTDPIFSLRPCEGCEPLPVVNPGWRDILGGGEFYWTRQNECAKEYRIYWRKIPGINTCDDEISPGFTGYDYCAANTLGAPDLGLTEPVPSTTALQGLVAGAYCGRIDTVYLPREGDPEVIETGEQWCFQSDCAEDTLPEFDEVKYDDNHVIQMVASSVYVDGGQPTWDGRYASRYNCYVTPPGMSEILDTVINTTYSASWASYSYAFNLNSLSTGCHNYYWRVEAVNPCGGITQIASRQLAVCAIFTPPNCSDGSPGLRTLHSWTTINGGPTVDLSSYRFSGGTYDQWEIIETRYGARRGSGGINPVTHELLGLPLSYTPPTYSYTGYMALRVICL